MRGKIITAENLPEGENVHLKKGITGEWRVVYPWKRDDGSPNWFAIIFGSKGNLIMLLFILAIAAALYVGVLDLISGYQEVAAHPCGFCNANREFSPLVDNMRLIQPGTNLSEINESALNLTSPQV